MSQNGPVIRRSSPQISQVSSISSTMLDVIVALLPALGMAVYLFGPRVLALTLVSVVGLCGGGVRLPPSDGAEQYGGRPVRLCHRPAAGYEPPGDRPLLGAGAGRRLCHRGGQAVLRRAGTELYESRSGGTGRCCAPFPG